MVILSYFIVVNFLAFVIMGLDKSKAKKRERRVPEKTLWSIALLGGSVGTYIGMKQFRHKTKHKTFMIGIPLIIFSQIIVLVFILLQVSA
ncbi:DUF1294 domain-containing protein [Alkalihalobacillus sp. MEB130]|uniref:DUF1294 domain-containing protein n=1 Tax=Alkalihalobacillus sp. MEB130 TaxID=2976704 RepID=UPI0028DEE65B|nr:DUF1294 domain-containing protein [Alkalihalobacillus sp. MEB130]MDT8859441.1 DUF1294 domain-containing protein [Alkalihalobacillus sp. MEB130]